jgi:hypothetical protein
MQSSGQPVAAKVPWHLNWKIMVPLALLGSFGACGACIGGVVYGAFSVIKSADVYGEALRQARADVRVTSALGSPLEDGAMPSGSVNVSNDEGHAELSIPVSGPRGAGKLHLSADRAAGTWSYKLLELEVEGQPARINLLP